MKRFALLSGLAVVASAVALLRPAPAPLLAQADDKKLANQARDIFEKNCGKCHGASKQFGNFDVRSHSTLVAKQEDNSYYIQGKKAEESFIWSRIGVNKDMPPKGPIPADEQKVIKAWIDAGAPAWDAAGGAKEKKREFVSIREQLTSILAYLREAEHEDVPYIRFFTLTHLHNNPEITEQQMNLFRAAMSKVLNSMHWARAIVIPQQVDKHGTVFAIDIRDVDWDRKRINGKMETQDRWALMMDHYFYDRTYRDPDDEKVEKVYDDIAKLTKRGKIVMRADWFVARATRTPIYEQVLRLPRYDYELEQKLGVDVLDNFRRNRMARAGYVKSGVSAQHRLVERHYSLYGAYWKSYDFKKGGKKGNLLKFPLGPVSFEKAFGKNKYPYTEVAFEHDGGEMIFNLPNGMQGYYLVNGKGEFITDGPIDVVQDIKNEASGSTEITNGLSCMVCHKDGMIYSIKDDVRNGTSLEDSDVMRKIRFIYVPTPKIMQLATRDGDQFLASLKEAMTPFMSDADKKKAPKLWAEPIIELVKNYYHPGLTLERVAYELGLKDTADLKAAIRNNDKLRDMGLRNLLKEGGTISRDEWDNGDKLKTLKTTEPGYSYCQKTADAMRLGTPRR